MVRMKNLAKPLKPMPVMQATKNDHLLPRIQIARV